MEYSVIILLNKQKNNTHTHLGRADRRDLVQQKEADEKGDEGAELGVRRHLHREDHIPELSDERAPQRVEHRVLTHRAWHALWKESRNKKSGPERNHHPRKGEEEVTAEKNAHHVQDDDCA